MMTTQSGQGATGGAGAPTVQPTAAANVQSVSVAAPTGGLAGVNVQQFLTPAPGRGLAAASALQISQASTVAMNPLSQSLGYVNCLQLL